MWSVHPDYQYIGIHASSFDYAMERARRFAARNRSALPITMYITSPNGSSFCFICEAA